MGRLSPGASGEDRGALGSRRAWRVLALMSALMVFGHLDRQVVAAMFPFLKQLWQLTDAELGALVSVVAFTVALGTMPLSLLADRCGRVKSLFVMAVVWSVACLACAFATRYRELFAARALVGVGEAAFGSVGAALLAALFRDRVRSTVLGTFLIAGLIGSVVGVIAGGVLTHHWGWRAAFVVAGVPGLLLAGWFFVVARKLPHAAVAPAHEPATSLRASARLVARELSAASSVPIACTGAGLQLVAVSTMYAWLPSFLNRQYGFTIAQAGVAAGLIVLVAVPGAVASGWIADRLSRRTANARYHVAFAAATLTALFMWSAFGIARPGPLQLVLLVLGAATMASIVGPVTAAVVDVVHPRAKATAAAALAATQNLLGLASGPVLTGLLSDRYGLSVAMAIVPAFCGAAALTFVAAAHAYPRDRARIAPLQPVAPAPRSFGSSMPSSR